MRTLQEVRENPPKIFSTIGTSPKPEVTAVEIAFEALSNVDTTTGKVLSEDYHKGRAKTQRKRNANVGVKPDSLAGDL